MENDPMRSESPNAFPTTCWGRVARAADPAGPDARAALAELCETYWYPIYAFIRRRRHDPDEALDLTQDYFARLLEKRVVGSADQGKGSFRAFLRTDCGFFLSHQNERDRALKRGGGAIHLTIDGSDPEGRYLHEPADNMTPERHFDQIWALRLLDDVLKQLAREYDETGRADQFAALRGALGQSPRADSYAALADRLGTTEGAVQQAVKRLRKRYKAFLRERVAATLDRPDEAAIDEEIRDLFAALGD